MKYIVLLVLTIAHLSLYAQYKPKDYNAFDGKKQVIFSDDFDSYKTEWDTTDVDPDGNMLDCLIDTDSIDFIDGKLYLFNDCNREVGTRRRAKVDIDYKRNIEIVVIAKALYDDSVSMSSYGVIYWNFNEVTGQHVLLGFTGFFNEIHTHTGWDSVKSECIGDTKVLKRSKYNTYNQYVRYTVRKYNDTYYVFINGVLKGTFPFQDTKGDYIGYGVMGKSKVAFDHLSISYLP